MTERERLIKKLADSMEYDNAQLFVDRVIAEALLWPLCSDCEGEGEVLDAPNNVLDGRSYWSTCSTCKGIGRIR
jgi:hypothetical protein